MKYHDINEANTKLGEIVGFTLWVFLITLNPNQDLLLCKKLNLMHSGNYLLSIFMAFRLLPLKQYQRNRCRWLDWLACTLNLQNYLASESFHNSWTLSYLFLSHELKAEYLVFYGARQWRNTMIIMFKVVETQPFYSS